MKKYLTLITLVISIFGFGQLDKIKPGESLTYRIHYGFLNAGSANLTATQVTYNGRPHYYVKGTGRTSGAVRAFFKVDDLYESYIDSATGLPSFYVRNVAEGSYRQHLQSTFNQDAQNLVLMNKRDNTAKTIKTVKDVQDMLSSFYYLRNLDSNQLRVGSQIRLNVWIDDNLFPFMLKVVGTENMDTKFGTINCLKIIPSVMSGRVFKDKEGVTLWVSNDNNHIPIQMKAQLAVGSLKADIDAYQNVKYPLNFK